MKNLKKVVAVILMSASLFSCDKEDCTCGEIVADHIVYDDNGTAFYSLTIENDCTGNQEAFFYDFDTWFNNHVGDNFCVPNTTWMPVGQTTSVKVENKEVQ
jgi:hypothetical protein